MTKVLFDIETDGLLETTENLWCIGLKVNDEPAKVYTCSSVKESSGTIEEGLEILKGADVLVGHNIISFDIPAIKKITGVDLWKDRDVQGVYDTLIASRLRYPNLIMIDSNSKRLGKLKGSHNLKAWGLRLKNSKDEYSDWSKLTNEMAKYCKQDVEVTEALYKRLEAKPVPQEAMDLEQGFAKIIQRQEAYGWLFNVEKAKELHIELLKEREKAEEELYKVFKPLPTWTPLNEIKNPKKKDGTNSKAYQRQLDLGAEYNEDLEWGYYKDVEFNPNSPIQRVRFIEHYFGKQKWELNDKGNPKTGEEDLIRLLGDNPIATPLVHYLNVSNLLGQLAEGNQAWLKQVKADGRIHGSVNTLGAVTRRCTHSNPNVAQVPSSSAYKGHECRELFMVPKGKKLVGCDADGLELRTLSHYMANYDGGAYALAVDEGKKENGTDIHTLNQKGAGLPTRDDAKTFIYAFLYGAGDGKIGKIVNGTNEDGKKLKAKFFKQIPAIKDLVEAVQARVKKVGYLKALDGNKYFIRSPHSALNTLLQGAGALVMKHYCITLDKELQKHYTPGVEYEFIGNIHDEVQIEV
jgi:DNA polymerase I-like protein with 3'-5' exonuclease and polymerase domains